MHWDGTVTLGNVLTIILGVIAFFAFYAKVIELLSILKEYPPHRHNGNIISYPSGMKPGPMERAK